MKTSIFDSFSQILIILFLLTFKLACDMNDIDNGLAMGLSHLIMKKMAVGAYNYCIALLSKSDRGRKEGILFSYCVVNYLVHMYPTDDVISEMDADIFYFTQPTCMTQKE